MSTRLRDAVIQHLRMLDASADDGLVRRITVEVEVGDRLETVILSLRGADLQCVSSDGRNEGPHVTAALGFVAGFEASKESLAARPDVSLLLAPREAS